MSTRWLTYAKPKPGARLRLYCFPYAGGSASVYRTWPEALPPSIEVCPVELPGHGTRFLEPLHTAVGPLARQIAAALAPGMDGEFALFGHSMGALIAFELAHMLRNDYGLSPMHLIVSAHRAPQISDPDPPISTLTEPEFWAKLRELNGTSSDVLEHAELLSAVQPLLRADFTLCDTYRYAPRPPLECPISAYGGLQDPEAGHDDLRAWREQTSAAFRLRMFEGDHFFPRTSFPILRDTLVDDLLRTHSSPGRCR
ncbi:MAG: thioesterase II family protein [Chloroflexota bacterium]